MSFESLKRNSIMFKGIKYLKMIPYWISLIVAVLKQLLKYFKNKDKNET